MVFKTKKAEETSGGFSTLVTIILILLVAGIVLYGVWLGFNYFFTKGALLPDDLSAAKQICAQYANNFETFKIDYCKYRSLNLEKVTQYANCKYVYVLALKNVGAEEVGFEDLPCEITAEEYCTQLACESTFKAKTVVNGKSCKDLGVATKLDATDPKCGNKNCISLESADNACSDYNVPKDGINCNDIKFCTLKDGKCIYLANSCESLSKETCVTEQYKSFCSLPKTA